jgi:hypothetical protein
MVNRITMETVACLRSICHLKQNLILSWPWLFRHTSCIFDFRCKKKYTNKKFCRTPGQAYLAVLPVLVIFCPLGPTNFKKSVHSANIPIALQKKPTNILPTDSIIYIQNPYYSERYASYTPQLQTTCNTQSSVQNLTSSVVRQRLQSTIW